MELIFISYFMFCNFINVYLISMLYPVHIISLKDSITLKTVVSSNNSITFLYFKELIYNNCIY